MPQTQHRPTYDTCLLAAATIVSADPAAYEMPLRDIRQLAERLWNIHHLQGRD